MALDPKNLNRWLRENLCIAHEGWGRVIRIEVRHVKAGQLGPTVGTIEVDEELAERLDDPEKVDDSIEAAVRSIGIAVQAHLDGCGGGRQRYVLHAIFSNSVSPRAELPFVENGSALEADPFGSLGAGLDETVAQNAHAQLLAVAARYNLGLSAQTLQATHLALDAVTRENTRLQKANERLMDAREEVLLLQEKLLNKKHKRDLEAMEQTARIQRKDRLFSEMMGLANLAAHRMLGPGGKWSQSDAPEEQDDDDHEEPQTSTIEGMIRGLMETLEEKQLRTVRPVLDQNQFLLVWELAQATQRTDEENRTVWREKFADALANPAGTTAVEWMVDLLDRSLTKQQRKGVRSALNQVQAALFDAACDAIRTKRAAQQSAAPKH